MNYSTHFGYLNKIIINYPIYIFLKRTKESLHFKKLFSYPGRAEQAKRLATKPDNLSFVLETHMIERENHPQVVLSTPQELCVTYMSTF